METFKAIGIMSGTSLDGLDLAYCIFKHDKSDWSFDLLHAKTVTYPNELVNKLSTANQLSGLGLKKLDIELGGFIGNQTSLFISALKLSPDIIASHGHTIYHQPQIGLTHQIGDGNLIYAKTGVPVVFDFRSLDLAHGGDGAPLVPIGDKLLFSDFDACLNLGGIANLSFDDETGLRRAFDIVPVNMVLNHLSKQLGEAYDDKGIIARKGKLNPVLLDQWNKLDYYHQPYPKSLGYEWFEKHLLPTLKDSSLEDLMYSYCIHAAEQIENAVSSNLTIESPKRVLVTGGGAYNDFLMECLNEKAGDHIIWIKPDPIIIEFKEALIFGLLGVLRIRNDVNVLRSATGATQDSVGGILIGHLSNNR
ncbi:MAG: anhydro-N-acetylmuramic acid kinase [Cyclobacteriaceae bacterium]